MKPRTPRLPLIISALALSCITFAIWPRNSVNQSETKSLISPPDPDFPKSIPSPNSPYPHQNHSASHPQPPLINPSYQSANPTPQDVQPIKNISATSPSKKNSNNTQKTPPSTNNSQPTSVSNENFVVQAYNIRVPYDHIKSASPNQSRQKPQHTEEIALHVPPGMPAPVVFLDTNTYSPQIQHKLYEIAKEFQTNVSTPIEGISPEEQWSLALSIADERYIKILGFEAYNYLHLEARREALREKRKLEKSPPLPHPTPPSN